MVCTGIIPSLRAKQLYTFRRLWQIDTHILSRPFSVFEDDRSLTGSGDADQILGVVPSHTREDHRGAACFCGGGNLHEFIRIAMGCVKTKPAASISNAYQVIHRYFPQIPPDLVVKSQSVDIVEVI